MSTLESHRQPLRTLARHGDMPDVYFTNETDAPIHIGVWAVWLHAYTNRLAPGQTWKVHLAGISYTIEIRAAYGGHEFTPNTSKEAMDKIATAWAQGAASVLTAVGWGLGMLGAGGRVGRAASGALAGTALRSIRSNMDAAVRGGHSYFNDRVSGHLLTVPKLSMLDFDDPERTYAIRRRGGKTQLWDTKHGWLKGEE